MFAVNIAFGLVPVLSFLVVLLILDSYKLVVARAIAASIIAGGIAAVLCLYVNQWLWHYLSLDATILSRYVAPATEEFLKAMFVVYLVRSKKVGFLVDAAIYGFAVGAGFACAENIYFLLMLHNSNIVLWIVRGFGTAALHGVTTAMFAIISKSRVDRQGSESTVNFLPGLILAYVVHSLFNHFVLPPVFMTLALLAIIPVLLIVTFERSERATAAWLGSGMDADMELLDMLTTDKINDSNIGRYLQTIKDRFPGPVVADMLCLLRIHCELALGAKAILLMRKTGITPPINPDIEEKLEELKYLERNLGTTGRLAIMPFLKTSSRDLWQRYMLNR